jgi:hypothetical protein
MERGCNMRSLIEVITTDLEDKEFIVLNLYDMHGRHADQIIKAIEDEWTIINTIVDVMYSHEIKTVDLQTDSEQIYKTFVSVPGINVSLVLSPDLASLYNLLSPDTPEFAVIQELYLMETTEKHEEQTVFYSFRQNGGFQLVQRFLISLKKLMRRDVE